MFLYSPLRHVANLATSDGVQSLPLFSEFLAPTHLKRPLLPLDPTRFLLCCVALKHIDQMASERGALSNSSLSAQQTPCDTLPVPQNLLVSRLVETPDSPINIPQNPMGISILTQAPLLPPVDVAEGQPTPPRNLPAS